MIYECTDITGLLSAYHRFIIYVLQYAAKLKQFFKTRENAWTCDLKWCNYVICPAEGRLFTVFTVQYTDV